MAKFTNYWLLSCRVACTIPIYSYITCLVWMLQDYATHYVFSVVFLILSQNGMASIKFITMTFCCVFSDRTQVYVCKGNLYTLLQGMLFNNHRPSTPYLAFKNILFFRDYRICTCIWTIAGTRTTTSCTWEWSLASWVLRAGWRASRGGPSTPTASLISHSGLTIRTCVRHS